MNDKELPQQSFGIIDPDYAKIFTIARIQAWSLGYACLAHGSFTRDLDLLLVPWTEQASADPAYIVQRIADASGLKVGSEPSKRPHGRKSWTLIFPAFGDPRWVDISAFSAIPKSNIGEIVQAAAALVEPT